MDELLNLLSDAVATQNWLVVVPVALILVLGVVSAVLKALKKPVPILDTLIDLAKGGVKLLPKKEAPKPAEGEAQGVAAVVPVEEKKGPNP